MIVKYEVQSCGVIIDTTDSWHKARKLAQDCRARSGVVVYQYFAKDKKKVVYSR